MLTNYDDFFIDFSNYCRNLEMTFRFSLSVLLKINFLLKSLNLSFRSTFRRVRKYGFAFLAF